MNILGLTPQEWDLVLAALTVVMPSGGTSDVSRVRMKISLQAGRPIDLDLVRRLADTAITEAEEAGEVKKA